MKKFLHALVVSLAVIGHGTSTDEIETITNNIQDSLHEEESNFSFLESLYFFIGQTIDKLDSNLIKPCEESLYQDFKIEFQHNKNQYNFLENKDKICFLNKFKKDKFNLVFSVLEKINEDPTRCDLDVFTGLIQQMNKKISNDPSLRKVSSEDSSVVIFNEELISGDGNQCGFVALGTTREDGITLIEDQIENPNITNLIASEIYDLFICGEYQRFVADEEKRNTIMTLLENPNENKENDLKAFAQDLIPQYLDYVKKNPVMLQAHPGREIPLLIDIIAALKGYSLNIYIQEDKNISGFINLDSIKKWHTFDPLQFGFSHPDGFKEHNILFTNFMRRSILSGSSGNWRNHFNILHKEM
ncbi:MAG: hypothetical protein CNLJKLNK_00724 [Holosporales bacterium]